MLSGLRAFYWYTLIRHTLEASMAVCFPRWVQNRITPAFGMDLQFCFLQKELRSAAQQLPWETNHMLQTERICFKTALSLQVANLDLKKEEHIGKVAKVIFKLKDTWGSYSLFHYYIHYYFIIIFIISQIDSVKSGVYWNCYWVTICYADADYPNYSFKYIEFWIMF